jgi:hydrogenase-4 component E
MLHMLNPDTARSALDTLALLLLATAIGLVMAYRIDYAIALLAAQGALLTTVAATSALVELGLHTVLAAVVTFAVKVVAIPLVLRRSLRPVALKREVEFVISPRLALLVAVALVFVAYYVAGPLGVLDDRFSPNALPAALALLLIGLFCMLTRRTALSQVIGLVCLENGIYLAAIIATNGLPLVVELGVAIDVLIGVVVMTEVSRELHRTFDTINTDRLRSLRG